MRKITNKRGYTLMEIVLVIAIIVIMLSAVSVGIAIDLNRYRENLDYLKEHPWEYEAVNKVRGLFGAPTPIPTASPTTEAAETTAPAEGSEAADETTAPAEETTAPAAESSAPAVETEKPNTTTTGVPAGWSITGGSSTNTITNVSQSGNSTVVTINAGYTGGDVDVTFTRNSDNTYTVNVSGNRTDLVQNLTSQYHGGLIDSDSGYVLTSGQYTWLKDNYGISVPSGYVSADNVTLSGGIVSSTPRVYYRNDSGVTAVTGSGNSATLTVNNGGSKGTFTINRLSDGTYTFSGDANCYQNYVKDYWRTNQDPNNPYSGYVSSFTSSDISGLLDKYNITLK